jgi:hypothetical protein
MLERGAVLSLIESTSVLSKQESLEHRISYFATSMITPPAYKT